MVKKIDLTKNKSIHWKKYEYQWSQRNDIYFNKRTHRYTNSYYENPLFHFLIEKNRKLDLKLKKMRWIKKPIGFKEQDKLCSNLKMIIINISKFQRYKERQNKTRNIKDKTGIWKTVHPQIAAMIVKESKEDSKRIVNKV